MFFKLVASAPFIRKDAIVCFIQHFSLLLEVKSLHHCGLIKKILTKKLFFIPHFDLFSFTILDHSSFKRVIRPQGPMRSPFL
jgi:hypothetical protein